MADIMELINTAIPYVGLVATTGVAGLALNTFYKQKQKPRLLSQMAAIKRDEDIRQRDLINLRTRSEIAVTRERRALYKESGFRQAQDNIAKVLEQGKRYEAQEVAELSQAIHGGEMPDRSYLEEAVPPTKEKKPGLLGTTRRKIVAVGLTFLLATGGGFGAYQLACGEEPTKPGKEKVASPVKP